MCFSNRRLITGIPLVCLENLMNITDKGFTKKHRKIIYITSITIWVKKLIGRV